jgi:DeoR/GlpR family transcriptional regulator of sugar metabolism
MKFQDRINKLKQLVKEKKEIPVNDLISILQVSPN